MIKVGTAQLWVHDQDEALAFWTEKVGMEVRADVTLAELALEMLFPADAETIEITKSMVQEQPQPNNTPSGNSSLIRDLVA